MSHVLFTCPATGMNVQHRLDDDPDIPENEYEAIVCPACTWDISSIEKPASC
jgi:hypothetical protein